MDHRLTAQAPQRLGLIAALALRLTGFVGTLAGAVGLVLALLVLAPGDPVDLIPNGEDLRPQLEAEWHLDEPLPRRYALYLRRLASGELGTSMTYRPGMPVAEVLATPARRSLGLLIGALALALLWGTALAALSAASDPGRQAGFADRVVRLVGGLAGAVSIAPVFLLAHLAVTGLNEGTFALMEAGYVSRPSWFALPDQASALRTTLAVVLLAVGSGTLAEVHQAIEQALVRLRDSGHVDAARARGAPLWPHVLPGLLLPLTTIATTRTAFLVGGLVIVEKVLMLNGAGAVLWQAALLRDYDLALGVALLASAMVCAVRLIGDAIRVAIDPRLRTLERR